MRLVKRVLRYLGKILGLKQWLIEMKQPKMIRGYTSLEGIFLPKIRISDTVIMYHKNKIDIKDNVFIGHYCILDGIGGVEIGEGTQLAAGVYLFTHGSHVAIRLYGIEYTNVPELKKQAYSIKPIKIGQYVFIGTGSKILPGVQIGDFALIAAGSVIKNNIPQYAIVQGNPAEIVGDVRQMDKKHLKNHPELKQTYVVK